MVEVLRAIIGAYRELFKAPALTEAVLFSNYALTALVVDEVCREVGCGCCPASGVSVRPACWAWRAHAALCCSVCVPVFVIPQLATLLRPAALPQGLVELTDRLSIQKSIAMRVRVRQLLRLPHARAVPDASGARRHDTRSR